MEQGCDEQGTAADLLPESRLGLDYGDEISFAIV
jgi:hypothetical protein